MNISNAPNLTYKKPQALTTTSQAFVQNAYDRPPHTNIYITIGITSHYNN